MNFVKYDLGNLSSGKIVEVSLSNAANVRLMNHQNFQRYSNGQQHKFFGGNVKQSPFKIAIPNLDHWFVAIDLGGYTGTIRSNVRVL